MKPIKCVECGKTLLLIEFGIVRIKCPRCGHVNGINIRKEDVKSKEPSGSSDCLHHK